MTCRWYSTGIHESESEISDMYIYTHIYKLSDAKFSQWFVLIMKHLKVLIAIKSIKWNAEPYTAQGISKKLLKHQTIETRKWQSENLCMATHHAR